MKDLTLFQDGKINDSTVDFITRYYAVSEFCPAHWIDKQTKKPRIADMVVAAMYGQSLGLNLFMSLAKISIINGKPNAGVEALLAIINSQNLLQEMKQWYEGKISDGTRIAFCYMKRRNGVEITKSFSIENAKAANLYDKQVWKSYTDHMLVTRATGFAIKTIFSDVACGLLTTEEAMDFPPPEERDDKHHHKIGFFGATTCDTTKDYEIIPEKLESVSDASNGFLEGDNQKYNFEKLEKEKKWKNQIDTVLTQFVNSSLEKIEERTTSEKYQDWVLQLKEGYPSLFAEYSERLAGLIDQKMELLHKKTDDGFTISNE